MTETVVVKVKGDGDLTLGCAVSGPGSPAGTARRRRREVWLECRLSHFRTVESRVVIPMSDEHLEGGQHH